MTDYTSPRQEIFDFVVQKLVEQGGPALRFGYFHGEHEPPAFRCMYRAPGDKKCAFGHLIPDDQYDPEMEDKTSSSVLARYFHVPNLISDGFFSMLQDVHDTCALDHWRGDNPATPSGVDRPWDRDKLLDEFQRFALQFGLDTSILDKMFPTPETKAA